MRVLGQPGFFDLGDCYAELSRNGDLLEAFRYRLNKALKRAGKHSAGSRPLFDCVLMFKVLVLQSLYNLSDDQTEYQIRGRLSFRRFLGLAMDTGARWMRRRSGCFVNSWSRPGPRKGCSPCLITARIV